MKSGDYNGMMRLKRSDMRSYRFQQTDISDSRVAFDLENLLTLFCLDMTE